MRCDRQVRVLAVVDSFFFSELFRLGWLIVTVILVSGSDISSQWVVVLGRQLDGFGWFSPRSMKAWVGLQMDK